MPKTQRKEKRPLTGPKKFREEDIRYREKRKQLSAQYGPRELWSIIDHWQLYCGIGNLSRSIAILDIFRETLKAPGHIAEFGVWRGANTLFLSKLLRIFDPAGQKMVHCFDSFEGMQEETPIPDSSGDYKGSLSEFRDMIDLYGFTDELILHKGLVHETIPQFLEEYPEASFSFIYCDIDPYEPTKIILEKMHPRLSKGGVFVLDEWNYHNAPGESLAVREFLLRYGKKYDLASVPNARQPSLVLRKKQF